MMLTLSFAQLPFPNSLDFFYTLPSSSTLLNGLCFTALAPFLPPLLCNSMLAVTNLSAVGAVLVLHFGIVRPTYPPFLSRYSASMVSPPEFPSTTAPLPLTQPLAEMTPPIFATSRIPAHN
ncbi:hypothetical protein CC85DRAFT_289675 [Cutaneotrichosporon oleaginosum]|uniref:Uncharacterized protein n=1 Tax=Cutaneotrichosporon oleaginosum TaxID=879819 RepID=A0A0J0XB47_9TREE|nr:uncharacterized protein CC85DRAFT_289675 [Cutaneotrichosporon oleaginosum]KLT38270.1 hypothetical protein CC85DRAFT_289675 [Cutaneotrichosporon oleaginosum]TXT12169.1 hypothetical protein COLE_02579 [Cutaneotrichosporon oleaginosum]